MDNAVIRAQGYAVSLEHEIRRVFQCDRSGFAGIADSDFIRKNPLAAVLATCGFLYAKADDVGRKQIENFIVDTRFYWEMSLDEFLSFETNIKDTERGTIELDYENGEKALEDIMDKFSEICDRIQ